MVRFRARNAGRLVLLVSLAGAPAQAIDIVFPPVQAFAHFPYLGDDLTRPGRLRFGFSFAADNTLGYWGDHPARFDFESLSAGVSASAGLTSKTTLELYLQTSLIWGGLFDRTIEAFHFTFGFPNGSRGEVGKNEVAYRYHGLYDYSSARGILLPPVLAVLSEIYNDDRWSIKTRFSLGIPVQNVPGLSSDKPFAAAGIILDYARGRFRVAWSHYLAAFAAPNWMGSEGASSPVYFSEIRVGWRSLAAVLTFKTSPLRDAFLEQAGLQLYLGWKFRSGLEIGFVEGLPPFETTTDIGLYLKYVFR